jgi:hypothetical protein
VEHVHTRAQTAPESVPRQTDPLTLLGLSRLLQMRTQGFFHHRPDRAVLPGSPHLHLSDEIVVDRDRGANASS